MVRVHVRPPIFAGEGAGCRGQDRPPCPPCPQCPPCPLRALRTVFFCRLFWTACSLATAERLNGAGGLNSGLPRLSKENQEQPQAERNFRRLRARENRGFYSGPQPVRHSPMGGCPVVFRRPGCTGGWRMPWRQEAMKDAASCDKPREAHAAFDPRISEWSNPAPVNRAPSRAE